MDGLSESLKILNLDSFSLLDELQTAFLDPFYGETDYTLSQLPLDGPSPLPSPLPSPPPSTPSASFQDLSTGTSTQACTQGSGTSQQYKKPKYQHVHKRQKHRKAAHNRVSNLKICEDTIKKHASLNIYKTHFNTLHLSHTSGGWTSTHATSISQGPSSQREGRQVKGLKNLLSKGYTYLSVDDRYVFIWLILRPLTAILAP